MVGARGLSRSPAPITLRVLPGALAVARLDGDAALPAWAGTGGGALWVAARTAAELSVVCADDAVPASVPALRARRALEVAGPLDPALTGVMAAIAAPLAAAGIPILAIATYDTDYVLVEESLLEAAVGALRAAGLTVRP